MSLLSRLTKAGRNAEFVRACGVFVSSNQDDVLVAEVYNAAGLFTERPAGVSRAPFGDADLLGAAVHRALKACIYLDEIDVSAKKPTDWPAFKASGCKTVRKFEEQYVRVFIAGANQKNLFYTLSAPELARFGLHLEAAVSAYDDPAEMGRAVQYLVRHHLAHLKWHTGSASVNGT